METRIALFNSLDEIKEISHPTPVEIAKRDLNVIQKTIEDTAMDMFPADRIERMRLLYYFHVLYIFNKTAAGANRRLPPLIVPDEEVPRAYLETCIAMAQVVMVDLNLIEKESLNAIFENFVRLFQFYKANKSRYEMPFPYFAMANTILIALEKLGSEMDLDEVKNRIKLLLDEMKIIDFGSFPEMHYAYSYVLFKCNDYAGSHAAFKLFFRDSRNSLLLDYKKFADKWEMLEELLHASATEPDVVIKKECEKYWMTLPSIFEFDDSQKEKMEHYLIEICAPLLKKIIQRHDFQILSEVVKLIKETKFDSAKKCLGELKETKESHDITQQLLRSIEIFEEFLATPPKQIKIKLDLPERVVLNREYDQLIKIFENEKNKFASDEIKLVTEIENLINSRLFSPVHPVQYHDYIKWSVIAADMKETPERDHLHQFHFHHAHAMAFFEWGNHYLSESMTAYEHANHHFDKAYKLYCEEKLFNKVVFPFVPWTKSLLIVANEQSLHYKNKKNAYEQAYSKIESIIQALPEDYRLKHKGLYYAKAYVAERLEDAMRLIDDLKKYLQPVTKSESNVWITANLEEVLDVYKNHLYWAKQYEELECDYPLLFPKKQITALPLSELELRGVTPDLKTFALQELKIAEVDYHRALQCHKNELLILVNEVLALANQNELKKAQDFIQKNKDSLPDNIFKKLNKLIAVCSEKLAAKKKIAVKIEPEAKEVVPTKPSVAGTKKCVKQAQPKKKVDKKAAKRKTSSRVVTKEEREAKDAEMRKAEEEQLQLIKEQEEKAHLEKHKKIFQQKLHLLQKYLMPEDAFQVVKFFEEVNELGVVVALKGSVAVHWLLNQEKVKPQFEPNDIDFHLYSEHLSVDDRVKLLKIAHTYGFMRKEGFDNGFCANLSQPLRDTKNQSFHCELIVENSGYKATKDPIPFVQCEILFQKDQEILTKGLDDIRSDMKNKIFRIEMPHEETEIKETKETKETKARPVTCFLMRSFKYYVKLVIDSGFSHDDKSVAKIFDPAWLKIFFMGKDKVIKQSAYAEIMKLLEWTQLYLKDHIDPKYRSMILEKCFDIVSPFLNLFHDVKWLPHLRTKLADKLLTGELPKGKFPKENFHVMISSFMDELRPRVLTHSTMFFPSPPQEKRVPSYHLR